MHRIQHAQTIQPLHRFCTAVVDCAESYSRRVVNTGTLFASTRHTVAFSPGNKGWVINEGDWPGQLLSFVLDSDGEHWRGIKVGVWAMTAGLLLQQSCRASAVQLQLQGEPLNSKEKNLPCCSDGNGTAVQPASDWRPWLPWQDRPDKHAACLYNGPQAVLF